MGNNDVNDSRNKNDKKPFKKKKRFHRRWNKKKEVASKKPATKEDLAKLKDFFDQKYKT